MMIVSFYILGVLFKMDNSCPKALNDLRDRSSAWVDLETLDIVSSFPCKGGLDHTFTEASPSLDREVLSL